jgi:uncharacterized delta-60 repeat protein
VCAVGLAQNPAAVDESFAPRLSERDNLRAALVQADGRIVVAGRRTETTYDPEGNLVIQVYGLVARLTADGALDEGFNSGSRGENPADPVPQVSAAVLQADGGVVLGGQFTLFDSQARLNADGTLDQSFAVGAGAGGIVQAILVQPDQKVVVGGAFAAFNGTSCGRIVRLNPDGSLDADFQPGAGADTTVYALALQPDGKLLVGGNFTSFSGRSLVRLARLKADGTVDESFDPGAGANSQVRVIAVQPDGKIVVGGNFGEFAGRAFNGLVRLQGEAASSVVKPSIVIGPQSQAVWAGGEVAFWVSAVGTPPLSYQWLRGQEGIGGATGATLVLRNVEPGLAGEYRVVVSNAAGSVTSEAALLTVMVPPRLGLRPTGAGFEVTVTGQPGTRCILEYSTDLSDRAGWELLTELVLQGPSQQWLDRETEPTARAKFYRVEVQP